MTRRIPLTRGHYTLVDDADYLNLSRWRWHTTSNGYATRSESVAGKTHTILLHRFLLDAQSGSSVDHIDGDRLNNCRTNLRLVTPKQNQQNRKATTGSASGYKGVTRANGRWLSRIYMDGQQIHLGYHDTAQSAAYVYDHAARRYFGPYVRVNFPDMPDMGYYRSLLDQVLTGTQPKRKPVPKPKVPQAQSRFTGVYWERGRWRSCIKVKGRKQHLGYFMDEIAAARAYDRAAAARDGERAHLNFPTVP